MLKLCTPMNAVLCIILLVHTMLIVQYSLCSILIDSQIDVCSTKIYLDTSMWKSIKVEQREYFLTQ